MSTYTKSQLLDKIAYYIDSTKLIPNYVIEYANEQQDMRKLEEILGVVYNLYKKEQQTSSDKLNNVVGGLRNFFSGVVLGNQAKRKDKILQAESQQTAIEQKNIDSLFESI